MWTTVYTEEAAEEICRRVSAGETLPEICRTPGMPPRTTVNQWITDDREGFAVRYARAKDLQIEHWADELLAISDDGKNDWMARNAEGNKGYELNGEHVQRSRLRSDNRKWLLSKLKPDKYGDRTAITGANGKDLIPDRASDPQRVAHALLLLIASGVPAPVIKHDPDESGSSTDT